MVLLKHIPHELIVEILSWLSIKHLSPLRFVSKSWFQLITANPRFAELHYDRSKNKNQCILAYRDVHADAVANLYLDYTSGDEVIPLVFHSVVPLGSSLRNCSFCNGLGAFYFHLREEIEVLNPLTKESITVSNLPIPPRRFPHYNYRTTFGFGYNHHLNKYKLIRFFLEYRFGIHYDFHSEISVYTLGVDSAWRKLENDLTRYPLLGVPLIVSGAMHWLGEEIIAFDLEDEVFRTLLPPKCVDFVRTSKIVDHGGLLCIIKSLLSGDIDIWVMEEYGVVTSWSRKFRIKRFDTLYYKAVGITHTGKIIAIRDDKNLIVYNPETNLVFELAGLQFCPSGGRAYVGSIISPRFITGVVPT